MDFGLGKRNQRRCTLSCNRCFSTVLSVARVILSDTPFLCSQFCLGYSQSKTLHLFSVLLFCTRLRIFTLSLRVRLSSHQLHSELIHRQIKPAQGSVRGTCKGTAVFQVCQSYFGKPPGTLECICWAVIVVHSHQVITPALPVSEARQWHKGPRGRCRVELCRVGTAEGRLFEGVLGHAGYTRCGLQQSQASLVLVSHWECALKRPASLYSRLQ